MLERPFQLPRLAKKYGDHCLTVYVPRDYGAKAARGLLIWLHGGGRTPGYQSTSGRKFQAGSLGVKIYEDAQVTDLFEASDRIVCLPTAPLNAESFARWNLPLVDEYLADVIEELESFYSIDPNNVILGGHSMGGQGAYHLAHRMADRFASVLAAAGAWDLAYWPCLMGATFWMIQGINDADMFRRRQGTDISFARAAKTGLEWAGVDHAYREYSGTHSLWDARVYLEEWLEWSRDKRRDPFYPHVVALSPRGNTPWVEFRRHPTPLAATQNRLDFHELAPAPHARWVSIDGVGEETVMFDLACLADVKDDREEDWNNFRLTVRRKYLRAGLVETWLRRNGTVEMTAKNVTGATLWLSPQMVDLDNVRVMFKGKEIFSGAAMPSLGTLMESYRRRRDWGMLYPAKIPFEADESWESKDQLKISLV